MLCTTKDYAKLKRKTERWYNGSIQWLSDKCDDRKSCDNWWVWSHAYVLPPRLKWCDDAMTSLMKLQQINLKNPSSGKGSPKTKLQLASLTLKMWEWPGGEANPVQGVHIFLLENWKWEWARE